MKLLSVLCVAAACVASLGAQTKETETKTKLAIKDGKEVTVTGCVAPSAVGKGFVLTNVADKSGALHDYTLVSDDNQLSKHVGHRVQVHGKVTDCGDAKVQVKTDEKTKVEHGDDKETRSQSEIRGDVNGMAYLGVTSVKLIAAACP